MSFQIKPKIAHLILAAGSSSRMGTPKQLLRWGNTTLISHAIMQTLEIENVSTYVVLGANYNLVYQEIAHFQVTILKNSNWSAGMGTTISFGVNTILNEDESYDAILITLVDQPLLEKEYLHDLILEFEKNNHAIIASDLGDRIGVPAIFSGVIFNELTNLKEDFGARYIIKKHINNVKKVSAIGKGNDIDTIEEYDTLFKDKFS
ncbi:hypothetical protein AWE51_00815 [Aquimarina aggregata]|uniref:MobA-like NTP transferase domain-containing protein n=1 Tax=Aquimarina aggregata TaxID=1642818 RepID=A0A163C322_9FLAO|nr:nucleotidyltransferase family protein [Aquimarina aggregata]KZS42013.1 hypothetical protein AWE51_00815 [Aquimarina aggregata]